ncbi:hypothetical protein WN51_05927 [Melipona quadrifasciata]|uniref:Uncharacterized protein n=1 Tax=Melipona quadrifasciata TaxID=166423 RepID=A0A0M9A8I2_9HYME|nr:hypothetical protein WN51_05927 [Melipona quadrifasciata]
MLPSSHGDFRLPMLKILDDRYDIVFAGLLAVYICQAISDTVPYIEQLAAVQQLKCRKRGVPFWKGSSAHLFAACPNAYKRGCNQRLLHVTVIQVTDKCPTGLQGFAIAATAPSSFKLIRSFQRIKCKTILFFEPNSEENSVNLYKKSLLVAKQKDSHWQIEYVKISPDNIALMGWNYPDNQFRVKALLLTNFFLVSSTSNLSTKQRHFKENDVVLERIIRMFNEYQWAVTNAQMQIAIANANAICFCRIDQ